MADPSKNQDIQKQRKLLGVLSQIKSRREAGQSVDAAAMLRAFPELEAELRAFFDAEGEGRSADDAFASTRLGHPQGVMSSRDTFGESNRQAGTASQFAIRKFGRYQLLRPLGEGAMGSVFLALDTTLDRQVALKMPKPTATDTTEFLTRFTREARAAAGLNHPNICRVYDAGQVDGTAYITMDFIDGVPLSELVGSDRLTAVLEILRLIRTIADAVMHAHSKGVIHRDLKPGNILVDGQMNPFVTDFGLARRAVSSDGTRITQEGLLIGTPAYMAPEQVRGEQSKVGMSSDIYSLGVIFFELLTGRLPFEGSVAEMLAKVLRDPPPIPSRLRPDLTEDVDDVVWKMLLKDSDRRYQSMQEVIAAIDKLSEKLQQSTSRETTTSARATTAAAQSPFEIQKSHIESMLKKGQYAGAIRDLEALAEEKSPAAKAVAEWARKTLPNAKLEAKSLSPSGLAAMLKTAEQMFEKCDYQGCIQLLDDVPSLKRSEAMETLLRKAQQREVAAEELMEQIRDKERRENPEGLEALVKKYLKLKPGNAYAKKLMQALQTYSKTPAGRRKYRFERGRLQPMPEISFFRQYALLAVLVGTLSFLATYAYVIVYLKGGSQTLAVHVDDEWLKEQGGELTLLVDGDEHTISTSPASGEALTIVVKVGDREFSVKHGDAIIHNPRTFTIERDGKSILQITPTDIELRNSPLIASGRIGGDSGQETIAGGDSQPASRVRIRPLTELNSSGLDISAWVSGDGLRIYWEHHDSPGSEGVIYQAERNSLTSPFENKRQVLKGHQPTLTDDELQIVFVNPGSRGPKSLMTATRTSRSESFANAKEIDPGVPYFLCNSPFVSSDGLTLTVNLKSNADNESTRYIQLRRVSPSAQWGGASELKIQWDAKQQGSPLTWIAMAADGLSFLATHEQELGGFRVLRFQRGSTDQPFERFEYLNLPGLPEVYGRTPRYVAASRELFLTAPAIYPTTRDANAWTNNYQGRLWVVEDVDLNAARSSDQSESLTSGPGPWIDLFDGKDTSRWQTLGQFRVEDGLLVARNGKSMAVSNDEFADFELEVEWRLSGTMPNGGIYYRELPTTEGDGNEYQLVDPNHRFANSPLVRSGAFYGVLPTKDGIELPLGQWNTAKIVCKDSVIEHWLNGQLLFTSDTESDAWKKALSDSTLKQSKDRIGTAKKGHILLQSQTGEVAFRKIRVRRISDSERSSSDSAAILTDLDRLASGQWISLVTPDFEVPNPAQMRLIKYGVEIDSTNLNFQDIVAKNAVLRADVRKVSGRNSGLHVRTSTGEDGTRTYAGWFSGANARGGDRFGIGKSVGGYVELGTTHTGNSVGDGEFVDMALAAIGDKITLFVNGKQVLQVQDSTYSEGYFALASTRTVTQFRNIRYQILDPDIPGKTSSANSAARDGVPQTETLAEPGIAPFDAARAQDLQWAWASRTSAPPELTDSIGIKLKLIPPGEFTMGSPENEPTRKANEGPQHKVRITQPFYIGATEITQKQWIDVMESRPWRDMANVKEGDDYPASYVDWNDAKEFCRRVSVKTGHTYRLPTEAEWEYACRAGSTTTWHFGDDVQGLDAHGWLDTNTLGTGNRFAHEVGKKKPNPFGLYDMHGNLFEWCEDFFVADIYARRTGTTEDPIALSSLDLFEQHITRGGGFDWNGYEIRSALRGAAATNFRSERDGFRVVRLCEKSPEVVRPEETANAPFISLKARALQEAWADHLKLPLHYTNSVGMKFRLIPPGEFTIGSSPEEIKSAKPQLTTSYDEKRPDRADSEGPQQRITISKPFYLGLTEVTQSQYQTVTGVNPSHYQRGGEGADKVGDADRSNAPVELVSWLDTGIFCDRLSSHEGFASAYHTTPEMISLTGSGGYRLPTEAEWEYACRAGTETSYFSGNDESGLREVAWTAANRQAFPQPVATRKANPFGLFDMHGNAWEWVHDSWRANTYELMTGAGALDPRCDLGSPNWKVIRGGAYHYSTAEARSACRDAYPADNRWHDTGFRVAVSVDAVRQKLVSSTP